MIEPRCVIADEEGMRLDRWFFRHYPHLSRGLLEKMLRTGQIRLDGKRVKSSARLAEGQMVRIPPQCMNVPDAETMEVEQDKRQQKKRDSDARFLESLILFEDKDVLAINKPPGLAVQGGTGQSFHLDALLEAFPRKQDGIKPKLVHRLDKDTSGVLLLAKTNYAATKLAAAFRHRDTKKIYWAVVIGMPKPLEGKVSLPLVKDGERMRVAEHGEEDAKTASTLYATLEQAGKKAALVALSPLSGRTHQLRVHMQALGTPILGDRMYRGAARIDGSVETDFFSSGDVYNGLHLHARQLIIPHPRQGIIDVTAPLSKELKQSFSYFNFSENYKDSL